MLSPWGSVFVNGVYYWPAYFSADGGIWAIRAFDFATESFSTIPRPPITLAFSTILVELTGEASLGCLVFECEGESKRFKLWSWRKGPAWVLLKEFVLKNVDRPVGFVDGRFLFLEEELEQHLHRLKVYDCLSRKLESLEIYDRAAYMQVVSYVNGGAELPEAKKLRCL